MLKSKGEPIIDRRDYVNDNDMGNAPWLFGAFADLGVTEIKGAIHNQQVVSYAREAGVNWIKNDEEPWCATAIGAWLARAGYRPTGSAMARSYEFYGQELGGLIPGCLAVFWRSSLASGKGHVAYALYEYSDHNTGETMVACLGGNQGDQVSISGYEKSKLLSYRWPTENELLGVSGDRFTLAAPKSDIDFIGGNSRPLNRSTPTQTEDGSDLGPLDRLLGGRGLKGVKTGLGIMGFALFNAVAIYTKLDPQLVSAVNTLLAGWTGLGLLAKVDRWIRLAL